MITLALLVQATTVPARQRLFSRAVAVAVTALFAIPLRAQDTANRHLIQVTSSIDRTTQPSYLFLPPNPITSFKPPLVVLMHSWSYGMEQRHVDLEADAARRGWILLEPNFRGRNDHPDACGSKLAQQDVLDAVAWVRAQYQVDSTRIYVTGNSGGGYMTMLMVEAAPTLWAAASAWVGISDLMPWYEYHATDHYGEMTRQCLGGPPSAGGAIANEYRARSPLARLTSVAAVPIDLAAGRHDTTVPISHTLLAFNMLARANRSTRISESEMAELTGPDAMLRRPGVADTATDPAFGRAVFLRRYTGRSRITIFEGGHEWLPATALTWLALHHK